MKKTFSKYLQKISEVKELNMNVADMLLYIYQQEIHPSKNAINEIIKNEAVNEVQALYIWLMDELEMNLDDPNNLSLCNKYFLANMHEENVTKYAKNPYVKAISKLNIKDKNYSLKTLTYQPYQLFPLDDLIIDEKDYYSEFTPTGFFKEKYSYLALLQNNKIWMSLNPNEINTMEPHIAKAKGNILVLGLGLGYFPFMCSLKDEVKHITIIEKDKEIIHLFNEYLLNRFPYKDKITIIESDAVNYIKSNHNYDYIFADLWHDPIDGMNIWYSLKQIEKLHNLNMSYWINNSFIALKNRIAIDLLHYKNTKNEVFKEFP